MEPVACCRRAAEAAGWTHDTWLAGRHIIRPYSGMWELNCYGCPVPPRIVAASAPVPPLPEREACNVGEDGFFIPNTRADACVRTWASPVLAGKGVAARPLLVVGQSVWAPATKFLRSLHAYPTSYERCSMTELPHDATTAQLFRRNIYNSRVVLATLGSVTAAAAFVQHARWLLRVMPHTSFAFFVVTKPGEQIPAAVSDVYRVVTWRDALPEPAPSQAARAPAVAGNLMATIEASHVRRNGRLLLGMTSEQRLGLVQASFRDEAAAANQLEVLTHARRISAMAGSMPDPKRIKLTHFSNPALVGGTLTSGADFGRWTIA
jgi:hypothetical protein